MDASVWVAKTGLTAMQKRMTVIANNLANVNTVAFKRDRAVFEDLLYQNIRQPGASADAQTIAPTGLMMGTGSRIIARPQYPSARGRPFPPKRGGTECPQCPPPSPIPPGPK